MFIRTSVVVFPNCSSLMKFPHLVEVTSVPVSGDVQMELDHVFQWALKSN